MKICIVRPNKSAYSETFIRAHIDRLPVEVRTLYGSWFPMFDENDRPFLPPILRRGNLALARLLVVEPSRLHRMILRHYPRYLRKMGLKLFLRRERIEAVLAEYGPTGVAVMDACKETNIPLIVHFHGFDVYDRTVLKQSGPRYPELFKNAAAIIAVSRDMERQLLHLGTPAGKLHYNPYGVDVSLFQGADPAHTPPIFIAVGRFVEKKAPCSTLIAFKMVLEACPEASLIMIGDGRLLGACKELCRSLGISQAVDFRGSCPHPEVASTLRQARVFVQHSVQASYGDSEGTPVAVLEAGATGLPVVATRHAGIQDVVIDGETGLLVEEQDTAAMAAHMLKLALDGDLVEGMGKRARAHIVANYSMDKSIGNLWGILREAVRTQEQENTSIPRPSTPRPCLR